MTQDSRTQIAPETDQLTLFELDGVGTSKSQTWPVQAEDSGGSCGSVFLSDTYRPLSDGSHWVCRLPKREGRIGLTSFCSQSDDTRMYRRPRRSIGLSMLRGAATLLDLSPAPKPFRFAQKVRSYYRRNALEQDWMALGADVRTAMQTIAVRLNRERHEESAGTK